MSAKAFFERPLENEGMDGRSACLVSALRHGYVRMHPGVYGAIVIVSSRVTESVRVW